MKGSSIIPAAGPLKKVRSADDMDVETFLKHINARHTPIGKMTVFGRSNIVGDENESLLRVYHQKTHDLGIDSKGNRAVECNHQHGRKKA